jgi:hypothetical protein
MTGDEHYREAEQLLTEGADAEEDIDTYLLRKAHVHATLALAAAVALAGADDMPEADGHAWRYAAGTKPPSAADTDDV